jgi:hypothetical protein
VVADVLLQHATVQRESHAFVVALTARPFEREPGRAAQLLGELRVAVVAIAVEVAVGRLAAEDLFLPAQADGSDAFACSASLPNAAGSLTARSASTLRSSSTPADFRPAMNWL